MTAYLLSVGAGLLASLSPCVLPALPMIVGSAASKSRLGPLMIAIGMTLSFAIIGVLIASVGFSIGLNDSLVRSIASSLLVVAGFILVSSKLQNLLVRILTPFSSKSDRLIGKFDNSGLWGLLIAGMLLGAVWSPCTGPTLGAAIGLASQQESMFQATILMILFGIGVSLPLLAIAYGARSVILNSRGKLLAISKHGKVIFGYIMIILGISIILGFDKYLEVMLLNVIPEWITDLSTSL